VERTTPGPGRPRDAAIDDAVLAAARELLAEGGYDHVTMDAAAARAGTSKAAVYRRYGSKAELLFAAALHPAEAAPPPDTGSLRGDLIALGRRVVDDMTSPAAREVAPRVIAEISRSADVAERWRTVVVAGERAEIDALLARAASRGELADPPPATTLHRAFGGALFFSVFVIGDVPDDAGLEAVVDLLLSGVAGPGR
jgi:AcrR family transcriptional regulator